MSETIDLCPICSKPAPRDGKHFPFCSSRCKTIDLGVWSAEEYVVSRPVTEADEYFESISEPANDEERHE